MPLPLSTPALSESSKSLSLGEVCPLALASACRNLSASESGSPWPGRAMGLPSWACLPFLIRAGTGHGPVHQCRGSWWGELLREALQ